MTALDAPATANTSVACEHCGLPVPKGLVDPAADHQFCCSGCETVYGLLEGEGLDEYYQVRDAVRGTSQPVRSSSGRFEAFDTPEFQAQHCRPLAGGYRSADLRLGGVHCAACMWLVERLPRLVDGLASARLHLRDATVRVTWDQSATRLSSIAAMLDRLGYTPYPARETNARQLHRRSERSQLIRLGVAGACAGNIMLLAVALYAGEFVGIESEFADLFRYVSAAIGLVSLAWPGGVFFRGAWSALRARCVTLDVPIALALAAGGTAGLANVATGVGDIYFDSLSVLVFLLLVGRWFQARQQRWADEAVDLLHAFTPSTCRLVRGDEVMDVTTDSLTAGDVVEVTSGAIVPVDGVVLEGRSTLNRGLLTGESASEPVAAGDEVFAGTQNMGGVLRIRAATLGEETRVGRLMNLVADGVREKPPIVQFTDRAAGWFVAVVVVAALATFAVWATTATLSEAVNHTVALLIVACPCALGLATPLTMAVAIARAASRQVLIKNAAVLEVLAGQGEVLLDKTGTLTRGRPVVCEWLAPEWLAPVVAHAESHSTHPIARALVESFADQVIADSANTPRDVVEQPGGGLRATVAGRELLVGSPSFLASQSVEIPAVDTGRIERHEAAGRTVVAMALGGRFAGMVTLGDRLHADSAAAVRCLEELGWSPRIVSGDAAGVVECVASDVGIPPSAAFAKVSPEDKLRWVRSGGDGKVVMIGDGVNDAAALAAADVGIAVEGGAEASLAAADVYVAAPGLMPIVELVLLARRTCRTLRRNLFIALAYNTLAVSLAAAGWITPLAAAILMPISSATVLASAMRIHLDSRD